MNIAMTVWGDRVSPVLDCARTLLVAEIDQDQIVNRRYQHFEAESLANMLRFLVQSGVKVLVCGAVSQEPAHCIEDLGIELLPFVAGDVETILAVLVRGGSVAAFAMPGCRCKGRCRMLACPVSQRKMRKGDA
ncbi:MAG: dinitrogenase iron-molybdenum cofactor biosynthesis domain-containing protein [Desulfobulbaceae bacterium]|nr:MAG: dinitrogenase iron-molybdenum cofactor biosynthesis domain-containing protein [Desulfobulbaceae bacterium]